MLKVNDGHHFLLLNNISLKNTKAKISNLQELFEPLLYSWMQLQPWLADWCSLHSDVQYTMCLTHCVWYNCQYELMLVYEEVVC